MKVKHVLLTIAAALGIGGVVYAFRTKKTGDSLDISSKSLLHSTYGSTKFLGIKIPEGIEIRSYVTVKNPTDKKITIKQPYIRLFSGIELLGSSQTTNVKNEIPANQTKNFDPIIFQIPFDKILPILMQINFKGIANAGLSLVERAKIIVANLGEVQQNLNLNIVATTEVNGFAHVHKEKF